MIHRQLVVRIRLPLKHPISDFLKLSPTYTCIVSTWFGGKKCGSKVRTACSSVKAFVGYTKSQSLSYVYLQRH
ncbi:MAG: hypothetical protein WBY71_08075 [Nitrososphaeraceae archaeon]